MIARERHPLSTDTQCSAVGIDYDFVGPSWRMGVSIILIAKVDEICQGDTSWIVQALHPDILHFPKARS